MIWHYDKRYGCLRGGASHGGKTHTMSLMTVQASRLEAIGQYLVSLGAPVPDFLLVNHSDSVGAKRSHRTLYFKRKAVYSSWWTTFDMRLELQQKWYDNIHVRELLRPQES